MHDKKEEKWKRAFLYNFVAKVGFVFTGGQVFTFLRCYSVLTRHISLYVGLRSGQVSPYPRHMCSPGIISFVKPWVLTWWERTIRNSGSFRSENLFRGAVQTFCGYWIRLSRNARSGKVGSSHCYLDRRPLHEIATFDEIVMTKNILNNWLNYQE